MAEKRYPIPTISRGGMPWIRGLVLLVTGLAALSGFALAHPPAGVAIRYEDTGGDLVVAVTHQVDDPATHYIQRVMVRLGTAVLINESYTSQPDTSPVTYRYHLPDLKGSSGEITVDAACSRFGSRSGTLPLGGTTPTGAPPSAPLPEKAAVLPLIAVPAAGIAALWILRQSHG